MVSTVEQSFQLAADGCDVRMALAIRTPAGLPYALRSLSPLTPAATGQANLRLAPWSASSSVIDFGWTAAEDARFLTLAQESEGDATNRVDVVATGAAALGCDSQRSGVTLALLQPISAIGEYRFRQVSAGSRELAVPAEIEVEAGATFGTIDLPCESDD